MDRAKHLKLCLTALALLVPGSGHAQTARRDKPAIVASVKEALERENLNEAQRQLAALRAVLAGELKRAEDVRVRRRNRRTSELLNTARKRLNVLDREAATVTYARSHQLPYAVDDLRRLEAAIGMVESTAADADRPDLELMPKWVLQVNEEYVMWSLNGSMRAPRRGYQLPEQLWMDEGLRSRLVCEGVDGMVLEQPGASEIRLAAAAHEYEPLQIIITPRSKALTITGLEVSDLLREGGPGKIDRRHVSRNLVGYVWGKEGTRDVGPFPDVLLPWQQQRVAEPGHNYTIWLTFYVPPGTPSGDYYGQVTVEIDGERVKPVPIRLHVWDFELPRQTHVATQLFGLDVNSLCYWYGVAPWQERALKLMCDFHENMARHRFSPSNTPAVARPTFETFPSQIAGRVGKCLKLRSGPFSLPGPRFEQMSEGLTVCFWLQCDQPDVGNVLKQQWHGRPSGYWMRIRSGKFEASVGYGIADQPQSATAAAGWDADANWHHVALGYQPGTLRLFLDGHQADERKLSHNLSPSYSIVTVGGADARFAIDEIRWAARALSARQIREEMESSQPVHCRLAACSFDSPEFDFSDRARGPSTEARDKTWFEQWVDWCQQRGLFLNGLPRPHKPEDLPTYAQRYYQPLAARQLLQRAYVRLPHDEASSGARAEENRRWSRAIHGVAPELQRHQTLGNMGGSRTTSKERAEGIRAYFGLVDIWSVRPLIFNRHGDLFHPRVEAGDNISLYIHDCDTVERDAATSGRFFFWYLWKYDLNMCTLWRTNLWFQPGSVGRKPERRTWAVDWGFWTTRRNPSGITCGCLFWPGPDGVLNSIRAENWREGVEDYEYLYLLRQWRQRAGRAASQTAQEADRLFREVSEMPPQGRHFSQPPTTDPSWIFDRRQRMARLIETLQRQHDHSQRAPSRELMPHDH
jgi:hypothetical protein